MRTLLVVIVGAALGILSWRVFGASADRPVTRADIEHAVAQKPRGQVQVVLCNEVFVASDQRQSHPPQTWTCDTYLGPTKADAQNGPSYRVLVSDGRIESIRRVPTH